MFVCAGNFQDDVPVMSRSPRSQSITQSQEKTIDTLHLIVLLSNSFGRLAIGKPSLTYSILIFSTGLLAHSSIVSQRDNAVYHEKVVPVTVEAGEFLYLLRV